ncbi:MAG: hypothetical protein NZ772_04225 [Cyanobacteria bacterium]|nr:hypothetical protein [Cyanobacteriota bacterium]
MPIKAILFQVLFLMVAIATESVVLHWRLGLQRRTSVRYAASLNLFSTFIGWLLFFTIVGWLPTVFSGNLEQQLISYILFDQFFVSDWQENMNTLIVIGAVLTFFGTFLVEINGLILLEIILGIRKLAFSQAPEAVSTNAELEVAKLSRYRIPDRASLVSSEKAYAILIANALSYTLIMLILVVRHLSKSPFI